VISEEAGAVGARDDGEGPAQHWFEHRYDISFKAPKVFADDGFVDTMELAAPWDRIEGLYRAVRAAIAPHAVTLAHFSHAYPDGVSVYFTFAANGGSLARNEASYFRVWDAGLAAARAQGGTVTHHHGVGLLKDDALREELGPLHGALGALKRALDPAGILNPGKLGL
jgi:alkyldihydroxyacetonephosphate synthase